MRQYRVCVLWKITVSNVSMFQCQSYDSRLMQSSPLPTNQHQARSIQTNHHQDRCTLPNNQHQERCGVPTNQLPERFIPTNQHQERGIPTNQQQERWTNHSEMTHSRSVPIANRIPANRSHSLQRFPRSSPNLNPSSRLRNFPPQTINNPQQQQRHDASNNNLNNNNDSNRFPRREDSFDQDDASGSSSTNCNRSHPIRFRDSFDDPADDSGSVHHGSYLFFRITKYFKDL